MIRQILLIAFLFCAFGIFAQDTDSQLTTQVQNTIRGKTYNPENAANMFQEIINGKISRIPAPTTGTNNYSVSVQGLDTYANRLIFVQFGNANTTAVTLVANTMAAQPVQKEVGGTWVDLASGDLVAGKTYALFHDGTRFQIDLGGSIEGTGVSNQITFWNGTNQLTGSLLFTWDNANRNLNAGTGTITGGTFNYNFGSNTSIASSWTLSNAEQSTIAVGARNSFTSGWFHAIGGATTGTGAGGIVGGVSHINNGYVSTITGVGGEIKSLGVTVGGGFVHAFGTPYNVNSAKDPSVPYVTANGGSFNISRNTSAQTSGYGALARDGGILGGLNHHLPVNSVRSVIIAGETIVAPDAVTNTVFMPKIRFGLGSNAGLVVNNTRDSVLVRNAVTGEIQLRSASSITGTAYTFTNGLTNASGTVKTGGLLTENTTVDGDGSYLYELVNLLEGNIKSNGYLNLVGNELDAPAGILLGPDGIAMEHRGMQLNFTSDSTLIVNDTKSLGKTGIEYSASGYVTQLHSLTDKQYVDSTRAPKLVLPVTYTEDQTLSLADLDKMVVVNTSGGNVNITVPADVFEIGTNLYIKHVDTNATPNTLTFVEDTGVVITASNPSLTSPLAEDGCVFLYLHKQTTNGWGLANGTASGSGSGDVVGPASATDGVPVLFDGTTGKLIKNSTPTGTGNPVLATAPTLTNPVVGTQTAGDNSTKAASTAYVDAAVAAAPGGSFSINVNFGTSSPGDGATLYSGFNNRALQSVADQHRIYIRKACTLKFAELNVFSTTAGTDEGWSAYVRVNHTTDYLIATVSNTNQQRIFSNAGLSISLSAGDYVEIKWVCPTWATNPASCVMGGYLYFE